MEKHQRCSQQTLTRPDIPKTSHDSARRRVSSQADPEMYRKWTSFLVIPCRNHNITQSNPPPICPSHPSQNSLRRRWAFRDTGGGWILGQSVLRGRQVPKTPLEAPLTQRLVIIFRVHDLKIIEIVLARLRSRLLGPLRLILLLHGRIAHRLLHGLDLGEFSAARGVRCGIA
jgi:hypothetical protein